MKTPDITPAQAKADAVLILGVASALGLKLDGQVSNWLTIAIIAAATVAHLVGYFADASLRGSRAKAAYEIGQAKLEAAYNDPVAAAERLEKTLARVVKALDAQSGLWALGSRQSVAKAADIAGAKSTSIPITETPSV